MTTRTRIPIVVAVLAGLGISAVARNLAANSRDRGNQQSGQSTGSAIGRLRFSGANQKDAALRFEARQPRQRVTAGHVDLNHLAGPVPFAQAHHR